MLRYKAYKSGIAAAQFLYGRILLRDVLVSYLGAAPEQIDISAKEHIKPVAECRASALQMPQFNLSHSWPWVVLGVHCDKPLGIDIECGDQREINMLSSMTDLFTPNERACLARCENHTEKAELFFRIWRCKEAVMKATGHGFGLAPASVEVLTQEDMFKSIVHVEDQNWHITQVTLLPGLDCAVAVRTS